MKRNLNFFRRVSEISKQEEWLYDPANKEIVDYLKKCLTQKATIEYGLLKKTLKSKKK